VDPGYASGPDGDMERLAAKATTFLCTKFNDQGPQMATSNIQHVTYPRPTLPCPVAGHVYATSETSGTSEEKPLKRHRLYTPGPASRSMTPRSGQHLLAIMLAKVDDSSIPHMAAGGRTTLRANVPVSHVGPCMQNGRLPRSLQEMDVAMACMSSTARTRQSTRTSMLVNEATLKI
jgi:hypothetical protein